MATPEEIIRAMTAAEAVLVLRRARKLIEDPQRWTRGALARDSEGRPVLSIDASAVSWCAIGAIEREDSRACVFLIRAAAPQRVIFYDDNRPHWQVLALFDRAIALAEAESTFD